MKVFKLCSYFFLYAAITACSNTSQVSLSTTDNSDYYESRFTHTEFTTYQRNSIKKPASSDQALMVSLLNRPMPEDQKMMLAFQERQNAYLPDSHFVGIQIKGNKQTDRRVMSSYAHLIKRDINAVSINR